MMGTFHFRLYVSLKDIVRECWYKFMFIAIGEPPLLL